jgi:hypothetical protein
MDNTVIWALPRWWRMDSRPDRVIGGHVFPYLKRWFVIPRNPWFNVYLHHFLRSDDDRALHTHPWRWNFSVLLRGVYLEHMPGGAEKMRRAPCVVWRSGAAPHRIELISGPVWTLFCTGKSVREWGFLCARGFVHWRDFTAPHDSGSVGRGCDQ